MSEIDESDGRYQVIRTASENVHGGGAILDAGCGQGRYLAKLAEDRPDLRLHGMDLSRATLASIRVGGLEKRQGVLTEIPWPDATFDLVYSCEAVEHAVDVPAALGELLRVTKPGGTVVIIDKPVQARGVCKIEAWEQWLDDSEMERLAKKHGCGFRVQKNVPFEHQWADDLFHAWTFVKP